ncbi:hypothetical protein RB195_010087 [Necator americanus]|uniref:Uncharacterized protein n=1 Tax=Necator americanus TaxID=51031 RepID=A0ABR1CZM8_NECAM
MTRTRSGTASARCFNHQQLVAVSGPGTWEVKDNDKVHCVEEQYCSCDEKFNNHCRRDGCGACPYAFACTCCMDVKSGVSCVHVHAALLYAGAGRRSQEDASSSVVSRETESARYSSDGDEEMMEIVVEGDVENEVEVGRSSTDIEDRHRDIFRRMEMEYASARESLFKVMRNPTAGTRMGLEQAESKLKEFRKMIDDLAGNVEESENNVRLARRPEVPPVGRPQTLTPIRKLHKRAHLRKEEQAKRKPTLDIPDCAQDERDACAVDLTRLQTTFSVPLIIVKREDVPPVCWFLVSSSSRKNKKPSSRLFTCLMNLSPVKWAARKREDRRPLYRRIFTNRRLDILHKTFIRSILGFILFSTSYCIVNTGIYYNRSGWIYSEFEMTASRFISSLASRWEGLFFMGFVAGAGFELFKIYFSFKGVNYYSVFKKKQLQKELDEFEKTLKDLDDILMHGVPRTL